MPIPIPVRPYKLKPTISKTNRSTTAKVPSRQYQDYEYGKHDPTVRTAIRIATALNSTVEALFSGEKKGE